MEEHSFKQWYDEEIKKRNLTDERISQILISHGFKKDIFDQTISDLEFIKFEQSRIFKSTMAIRGLDNSMIPAISELLGVSEKTVINAYLSTVPRKPED